MKEKVQDGETVRGIADPSLFSSRLTVTRPPTSSPHLASHIPHIHLPVHVRADGVIVANNLSPQSDAKRIH